MELSELGYALMQVRLLSEGQAQETVSTLAERFSTLEVAEGIYEANKALAFLHQNALPSPPKRPVTSPHAISLHGSLRCNMACRYCFAASARKQALPQEDVSHHCATRMELVRGLSGGNRGDGCHPLQYNS